MTLAQTGVLEVGEADFAAQVLERSRQTPVVVDFWAPWCGPCRVLGPTLERLAAEANGAWLLAKVNVDNAPRLSERYGIRGIPAVKAFKDGQVVAEFVGAQPESVVRGFLQRLAPSAADRALAAAQRKEQQGDAEGAVADYRQALASGADGAALRLGLGRALLATGEEEEARRVLEGVADDVEHGAAARGLLARARFAAEGRTAGGEAGARARLTAAPDDPDAQYALAAALIGAGQPREALELLLGIVRRDRRWRDDGARRAMLDVFDLLGDDDPLTREYRARLAQALF